MFESVFYTVNHNFAKDYRKGLGNQNQMVTNNLIRESCGSDRLVYFGKRVARMTLLKRARVARMTLLNRAGRADHFAKARGRVGKYAAETSQIGGKLTRTKKSCIRPC